MEFFSRIFISKMGVNMNLRIKTKNKTADQKVGFPTKVLLSRIAALRPCRQRRSSLFPYLSGRLFLLLRNVGKVGNLLYTHIDIQTHQSHFETGFSCLP